MSEDRRVRITEVGPRDGLQNESTIVPVAEKIAFVDALGEAGFPEIEVTSFVSPKWVPQLADAAEVMAGIARRTSTTYSVLIATFPVSIAFPSGSLIGEALGKGNPDRAVCVLDAACVWPTPRAAAKERD